MQRGPRRYSVSAMNKTREKTPPFSLLVKPASADCNLACSYCFYLDKAHLYSSPGRRRMSRQVLERLVGSYMGTNQPVYTFGWQGGEPLLMGFDFFRRAVGLQIEHGGPGIRVANAVQTNGILIDDEWAEFFSYYRFLVGCSLDGPASLHDRYRQSPRGGPSHKQVVRGIRFLQSRQVDLNILVLVSRANVNQAESVYDHLLELGLVHHQYIPCVEVDKAGNHLPFSISSERWGDFLCTIFDRWYAQDRHRVSVRNFDALIQKLADGSAGVCSLSENCCHYFVVEHNGDIYPCDFFVEKSLKIGNVTDTSWNKSLSSRVYKRFGESKLLLSSKCSGCDCLDLCMGDCLKYRLMTDGRYRRSHLCKGWRQFIHHSRERLQYLAGGLIADCLT